ncbi:hypothetical protein F5Y03DRAFT_377973 [Xylaria venustula]|nr:hypothetical protein F5Y03DRAFT_377973 [Xylaria venustula]
MFSGSRRRRPPTAPLNSNTANPNATTAAASAFMSASNQNPNKALSSAAAAAALRARPHTPTNVAEVQTKRTARRSASISSSGSARLVNGHSRLERRGSSSSMTERTFRSPSPRRPVAPDAHEPQPPVPRIPDGHKKSVPDSRPTGVAMQTFRTASQKIADEPPSWYGQPAGDVSNVRTSDAAMKATSSPPPRHPNVVTPQATRSDSRSSVNFSYPTAFRPQSPPASPTHPGSTSDSKVASSRPSASVPSSSKTQPSSDNAQTSQQLIYDPNSRRMVPKVQIEEAVEYEIKQVAEKPAKRRRDGAVRREGSQLAKGTIARARGTMVAENKSLREPPKPGQAEVETQPARGETVAREEPEIETVVAARSPDRNSPIRSPEPEESTFRSPSPSIREPASEKQVHTAQTNATCAQDEQPFKEGGANIEDHPRPSQTVLDVLDAIPTRQILSQESHLSQESDRHEAAQRPQSPPTREVSEPREVRGEQKVMVAENKPVVGLAAEKSDLRRSSSNSPARQARFAPVPAEKLAIRHAPLPRSASPIKSAMKQTSSVQQETSPVDNTSGPSAPGAGSPDGKEESMVSRRKSVRVSFDDQGTVVGESAAAAEDESYATHSPHAPKRPWFSNIGRSKKKETGLDDDEFMKPRPALPSFGSIREKKIRELGERPLVRPVEPAYPHAVSSSPELRPQSSSTLNDSETTEEASLGQSTDHAIGELLAQDQSSRNAANISRFREPLPPVVTSIEGSGYSSDSTQGFDHEDYADSTTDAGISHVNSIASSSKSVQPGIDDSRQSTPIPFDTPRSIFEEITTTHDQNIPQIAVIRPSPGPVEHDSRASGSATPQYFDVPGGFPQNGSDSSIDSQVTTTDNSIGGAILEPATAAIEPGQTELLPQTTLDTTTPVVSLDDVGGDDTDESVYSDAYEDIPDVDSGGFLSLDAIVESPINKESNQTASKLSGSLPTAVITKESNRDTMSEDGLTSHGQATPPRDPGDWEQAKAFWRSLTAEKRRQLELEAAEEAGVEGDREETFLPIRRNSKRKSSELSQPTSRTSPVHREVTKPEPRMRTSLRSNQPTKVVNTQPQTGMRKTMRSNGTQNAAKPSARQPASAKAPAHISSTSGRHQAAQALASSAATTSSRVATQPTPVLQRRGSDASDSSFKRSRPSPSGAMTFRKTMRQTSPAHPHESTGGSGRFSLRSLSPAGSAAWPESNTNFTTPSPSGMRRTLRSNSGSSHEGKRSSVHFPLFARSAKSPPSGSKFSSRFDDSSDDDERPAAGFRSRLDDSSDEEEIRPSTAKGSKSARKTTLRTSTTAPQLSRPAPVPEVEEDSPELPDSDDDPLPSLLNSPQTKVAGSDFTSHMGPLRRNSGAIGTSTLGGSRSGRGGFATSMTSPTLPTKDKRGSLFSRLRLNKKADQTGHKIQRGELVDSAARRDTRLERDTSHLKDLRSEHPSNPKLQKRVSIGGDLKRPTSAGNLFHHHRSATIGTATLERPPFGGNKRSFSLGTNPGPSFNPHSDQTIQNGIATNINTESYEFENGSVDISGTPKKKKFGALRRMFKLDD